MLPYERIDQWKRESALNRVHNCRVFLLVHCFLTEAESAKVKKRIAKWVKNCSVTRKVKR